jgi:hypothetical protein
VPADPSLWMEASGSGRAPATAVARTAVGGTIVVPALFAQTPEVDVNVLTRREIDLLGSYGAIREDYAAAVAELSRNPQRWARLVTCFPLAGAETVLERVSRGEVLKAALVPADAAVATDTRTRATDPDRGGCPMTDTPRPGTAAPPTTVMDQLRLDGRAALVTGGAQGLGRASAWHWPSPEPRSSCWTASRRSVPS